MLELRGLRSGQTACRALGYQQVLAIPGRGVRRRARPVARTDPGHAQVRPQATFLVPT